MCQTLPFPAVLGNSSTSSYKAGSILWFLCDLVNQMATIDNLMIYFYCIHNPDCFISQYFTVSRLFPTKMSYLRVQYGLELGLSSVPVALVNGLQLLALR